MRFLGPHSAGEGPHLVPISLKIGSPSGPYFEKSGSPWHVATVHTTGLSRQGLAPSTGTIIAASLTCLLTFAALSLLLAAYLLPHFSFNHRNVVTEAELTAALDRLGEAHRQELSRRWWEGRYSPFTGAGEARLPPQQTFSEQL